MEGFEEPNYEETDILIWDKRYLFDCETFFYIWGKSVYCQYDQLGVNDNIFFHSEKSVASINIFHCFYWFQHNSNWFFPHFFKKI